MRICLWFSLIVLSAVGAAFGQDTNFATGPQYLMTQGSPLFAQPLSTPSLSLAGPPLEVGADNATARLTAGAENQTASLPPADALPQVDFFYFYYGMPPLSVVEISFAETSTASRELPASILDTGVWQLTTAQALRERGYGVTLPEAAAYGKAHTGHASHVYTNADIDRLHNGS
ncbi:MAG: hypothetical protein WAM04_04210 [Candidatus Sulfotelmatobacter sp.]